MSGRITATGIPASGGEEVKQWVLNSIPDVFDGPEWDGKEPAQAWFDRVEAADKAAEAAGRG